jgi:hypothetical protein
LEGLDKFFEFKDSFIILYESTLSKNMEDLSLFLSTPLPLKPSPSLQTPKQTLTLFPLDARFFTEGEETREKLWSFRQHSSTIL